MTRYDRYKRKIFIKAVIVPLLFTVIATSAFFAILPSIENRVPNINYYSQQETIFDE